MAKLVAAGAVSHTALMIRAKDKAPNEQAENVFHAFSELGRRLKEKKVDTLIVLSSDHVKTFFVDNMPSICIGIGDKGEGWGDAGVPQYDVNLDQSLAMHLLSYGLENSFDLSSSYDMKLDHGFIAPLHYLMPKMDIPIVPVFINSATLPISPMKRMYSFGEMLAQAITEWGEDKRVAIIATGGLSHWVAVPRMGEIAEEFDLRFIDQLLKNQNEEIQRLRNEEILEEAGNGALEIRCWVAVAGAVPDKKRELLCYEPVTEWATGIGIMDFMGGE